MNTYPRFSAMPLNHAFRFLLVALFVGLLAGCASGGGMGPTAPGSMPAAGEDGQANVGESEGQGRAGQPVARGLRGIPSEDRAMFKDPNNPLSTRIIYFGFDSSAIQSKYADVIRAHAQYLANHPKVNLRLEGHTDKRGTREYNIALGARRAKSVQQAMVLAGAGGNQISTLSFGEERPAVMGETAEAYAKNRRVVFIYTE